MAVSTAFSLAVRIMFHNISGSPEMKILTVLKPHILCRVHTLHNHTLHLSWQVGFMFGVAFCMVLDMNSVTGKLVL